MSIIPCVVFRMSVHTGNLIYSNRIDIADVPDFEKLMAMYNMTKDVRLIHCRPCKPCPIFLCSSLGRPTKGATRLNT